MIFTNVKTGQLQIHAKILYRLPDGRFVHKDFWAPITADGSFDSTMMQMAIRKVTEKVDKELLKIARFKKKFKGKKAL